MKKTFYLLMLLAPFFGWAQRDASYTNTKAVNDKINNKEVAEGVKGSPFFYGQKRKATIYSKNNQKEALLDFNCVTGEMILPREMALLGTLYSKVVFDEQDVWVFTNGQWYFSGPDFYLLPKKKFSQGEAERPGYIQGTRDKYTKMYKFYDTNFKKIKGKKLRSLKKQF